MDDTRLLLVPGGTSPWAVATTHAALHKLVELHERAVGDPDFRAPHTVVVIRDPAEVPATSLRGAVTPTEVALPGLSADQLADPALFEGIDLVLTTSGSSSGVPRLVGLSVDALVASAAATNAALDGPGAWVLALPAHHIAGAQVLFRSALAGTSPGIVDTTHGFHPADLIPCVNGATEDSEVPAYLSLVPTQLRRCLEAGPEVSAALGRLSAVLVGGSDTDSDLLEEARAAGVHVVTTYGMTETAGGCVYDGRPLAGVEARTIDSESHDRLALSGPMLMTRYLDGSAPFLEEDGRRWILTGDLGQIDEDGTVRVLGRADDVIVSGGLSIAPGPVREATATTPGIADAWVLGLPDVRWGSIVAAAVVPEPGSSPSSPDEVEALARGVRDHVGTLLGRERAPRAVLVLESLPMLDSGKVDPHAIADEVARRSGTSAEWRR